MKKFLCKIFGHVPIDLDIKIATATCRRCGKKLKVSYDMCYGDTIVEGVIDD